MEREGEPTLQPISALGLISTMIDVQLESETIEALLAKSDVEVGVEWLRRGQQG